MPSCSVAKNPSGIEIVFNEADHSYISNINGKQLKYISGTGFLSQFYPVFDPDGTIAARCAKKEGITVEELQAKWKAKGIESCRLGTRCHEVCEDIILNRPLRNTAENIIEQKRFDNAIKMAKAFRLKLDILGVEKIVFSPFLGIAGTIDLFAQNKDDKTYYIIDHKTNEKIEKENTFGKFCLDPIQHVPDLSFYHYALQLNLYEYLLKKERYVQKDAKFKLVLNHITPSESKIIPLPDMQSEIKDMLIYHFAKKVNVL